MLQSVGPALIGPENLELIHEKEFDIHWTLIPDPHLRSFFAQYPGWTEAGEWPVMGKRVKGSVSKCSIYRQDASHSRDGEEKNIFRPITSCSQMFRLRDIILLSPPTIVMALYCAHHTMNGKREGWARWWYLNNGDDSRDHDHQVGRLPVVSKTSGDDAECRVSEHAKGGDLASRIQMRKCCRGRRMFLL